MRITYIDRKSGHKCIEKIYGHRALSLLYGDGFFQRLFSFLVLPILAHIPFFSRVYGYLQKRPASVKKIGPFIDTYGVDASEFAHHDFRSFNDFFIRKLKMEARPIHADSNVLAMPADGRYLVYPTFSRFAVKGVEFSLEKFLDNFYLANRYREGSLVIIRLCPSDYHRFHFPCDGVASGAKLINGPLYSVNPMALRRRLSILAENKRMITELETEQFGHVLYIEIGATSVGSIHQTYNSQHPVKKGEEKGYFEFGASCLALLFERGRVVFDSDLISNTEQGLETLGQLGDSLAKRA